MSSDFNKITKEIETAHGIKIRASRKNIPFETSLSEIYEKIDETPALLLSSGFDYPGRHSRWDLGFHSPALQFRSFGTRFEIEALSEQGVSILECIYSRLSTQDFLAESNGSKQCSLEERSIHGRVQEFDKEFPEELRSRQPSVFSVLRFLSEIFRHEDPTTSHLGLYGAFGYDLVFQFEDLEQKHTRDDSKADCHLYIPLELSIVDRRKEEAFLLSYSIETEKGFSDTFSSELFEKARQDAPQREKATSKISCDHEEGEFTKKVEEVVKGCERGDYFEVVLSQEFSADFHEKPTQLFNTLAKMNPSPYMFLINFGEEHLVGSSPEIYVRVTGKEYETCPIAGTVRRGKDALEDSKRALELLSSKKEEAELTMCTDVDRNDMARVCKPGSVKILGRRQLEFYSHLIHTVDHVQGTLDNKFDALDAFQTHMWACTVTGAPKPAALQQIEDLENSPRGWYSGAIGMISFAGDINTGITLRTATIRDGKACIRAGATLLFDSEPEAEEQETRTKAAAFLSTLEKVKSQKVEEESPEQTEQTTKPKKVLFIDCRDSFVHNLASYLREIGHEVITYRSGISPERILQVAPDLVFLSPGPGTPEEFEVPKLATFLAEQNIPTFGVCLGLQGIGQAFGANLLQLDIPVHGKASTVSHNGHGLFKGLPEEFSAGRYHSLYLEADSMPECIEICAVTEQTIVNSEGKEQSIRVPMAIAHKTLPIAAVQFHPESLMTLGERAGHVLLRNAIEMLTA